MSEALEELITAAMKTLRTDGFGNAYIDAAVAAYRQNLQEGRAAAAEREMHLAASPLSKMTSIISVDDPHPRESIGWQWRLQKRDEVLPNGWVLVDG